jgi:hypothetical protein
MASLTEASSSEIWVAKSMATLKPRTSGNCAGYSSFGRSDEWTVQCGPLMICCSCLRSSKLRASGPLLS